MARPDLPAPRSARPRRCSPGPTDGTADPLRLRLHRRRATSQCGSARCASTTSPPTADAPPSARTGSRQTLAMMEHVWTQRGRPAGLPRAAAPTATQGGSPQFDVYLKDLGGGLYGYCAASAARRRARPAASACSTTTSPPRSSPAGTPDRQPRGDRGARVLPRRPVRLRLRRGPVDDGVHGHLDGGAGRRPTSTTTASTSRTASSRARTSRSTRSARTDGFQYGNWVFWEYLSTKYGSASSRRPGSRRAR